jgi:hypothetical protein
LKDDRLADVAETGPTLAERHGEHVAGVYGLGPWFDELADATGATDESW